MPEGAHPLPPEKGWKSIPFVELDGQNWPLEFASRMLDIPLKDLQDLVRIVQLEPAGVIRMAGYSRQGRQPRAYPAGKLIQLTERIQELQEQLAA